MKYALLLGCAVSCASTLLAQEKKTVEPADIADITVVSDPQISPDGRYVAYELNTPVDSGKPKNQHIWLAPTEGEVKPHPFAVGSGTDSDPRWSPDGRSIAFLSSRKNPFSGQKASSFSFKIVGADGREDVVRQKDAKSEDEDQLWILPLDGGEALPLTDLPGDIKNPQWSRDGKFIAFVRRDTDTPKEHAAKDRKVDQIVADTNYKFDRLWIYDLARHEARLATHDNINIDDYGWSPDGAQIIARVSPTPRIDDYWRVSRIVLLSAESGSVVRVLEEHAGYITPRWSSDGEHVTFSRMTAKRITDEHVIFDLKTGQGQLVEKTNKGTIEQLVWTPDGKSVLAEVIEGAHTGVVKVDPSKMVATPVAGLEGVAAFEADITFSADGRKLSFLANSFRQATDVWTLIGGKADKRAESNPQVANFKLGTLREISWKNSKDGRTVYGVLILPPDYKEGQRYKTAVHIHGGPEEAWTTGWHGSWYDYAALLSSHGYVVLLPNPRGSDGQGPEFTEANFQDWGGGDFQDVQSGVDFLLAQGIADPDRMVVGGWSFGGFMTSWTVTHTNRFKAAMVGAGVTDLFSMATTTDIAPNFEDGYFGSFASSRQIYDAHSPVRFLDQCHTPVLVLHGSADVRVPTSQGQEFYNGLRFLGREAEFVQYPREPHIFTEREHQIDSLQRILDWYESHLPK